MAFAFDTETNEDGFVLTSLTDIEEGEDIAEVVTETNVREANLKTEMLIGEAERSMGDLSNLIGKAKTGTATRVEIDRIKSLHKKLDETKKAISDSKTTERETEFRMLHSKTREKAAGVMAEIKRKDIRAAIRAVCQAESVDLCFCMDCTSSMGVYIEAAKNSIRDIVKGIRSTNGNLKIRLAVVGYRDLCDGDKRFEVLDFTADTSIFENFITNLQAIGGGDAPEDMAGGIQKVNELSWSQPTRVVYLIADAPCHGTEFSVGLGDTYPSGTPGINIVEELEKLTSPIEGGSTTLTFGRITSITDTMIHNIQKQGITVDVVDLKDTSKLTRMVTRTVRRSVFKTMTVMGGGCGKSVAFSPVSDVSLLLKTGTLRSAYSLKNYEIAPEARSTIEWSETEMVSVNTYRNMPVKSVSDLREPINVGLLKYIPGFASDTPRTEKTKKTITMFMRRAPSPFAEGEIRLAYHAQLARKKDKLLSSHAVLKAYKHLGKGVNSRAQYFKQMEVSTIACYLAKKYNEEAPSHCAKIQFLPVAVVEEEDTSMEEIGLRRFCAEEQLPTDGTAFTKYSNNSGHWDDELLDESLLRFTKFTFLVTHTYLMVADLQGVKKNNVYFLTDPVILCKDILRFGNTNLGETFMEKCINATSAHLKENNWE